MGKSSSQPIESDAWNPGLESEIPGSLLPLVTLYRMENACVGYAEAKELSDFCGLRAHELIAFRPERLVIHELLVRVTADLSVPDGSSYEVLGINLRSMVATILDKYVVPEMALVNEAFADEKRKAVDFIDSQLAEQIFARGTAKPVTLKQRSFLEKLFGQRADKTQKSESAEPVELQAMAYWQKQLAQSSRDSSGTALQIACLEALIKVVGAIVGHRGRLLHDQKLITRLAANLVCNTHGCSIISNVIEPMVKRAIAGENYRVLPPQEKPVIMNVKGASASGKSTIRPQQRQLAEKLGIPWEDFALISPDYWRKFLLDYESLGDDFKYGAMLTGQELEIIDKKLDRYMAGKAARGAMSHLLIDRFRFDSFTLDNERASDSKLLSRFGDRVFMFFIITPPAETVNRAWSRGIKTGRYKAVDDLLYHNVEAFTGMPALFLSWVNAVGKQVHFEFLDNDVPEGDLPKTAAFGWNNAMTILDANVMIDIDRYRKVNIDAKQPDQIFDSGELEAERNTSFIERCAEKISTIEFADQHSAVVYGRVEQGELTWWDADYIEQSQDESTKVALEALGYAGENCKVRRGNVPAVIDIAKEKHFTFGEWGTG